jgi:Cu2+-exporting ATPase
MSHEHHEQMFKQKFFVSLLLSLPVLYYSTFISGLLGYTPVQFPGSSYLVPVFSTIIFAYGGLPFLRMAKGEYEAGKPGMMMLISLAILVAYTYSVAALILPTQSSFFWELVTLIDIMLLGHWIEMRSVRQASGALDELAELMPDTAERITDEGTEEIPVSDLAVGDKILVRPGASIPADGEVIRGDSTVNESMITGESKPVEKATGDEVIGGAVNNDGSLRVEITAIGDDTALSDIMGLVEEAQQSKSKTQLFADKAAGWLFYIALASGIITGLAWTLAVGFNVTVIERVVTVLVIACPHALGLAIPLVVAINTSLAAQNGILVRDRVAMEQARALDTVVFDKTGTLTQGEMGVAAMATTTQYSDDEALALLAGLEADSEHVIAEAIRSFSESKGVEPVTATGFKAIQGKGVKADVDGKTVYVGGSNLATSHDFTIPAELKDFADDAATNAATTVYLFEDEEAVAAVSLADVIRDESKKTISYLHDMGVEVAMLTGDSADVASAVADQLNIDTVFAEVLPEDKDKKIRSLQAENKLVGMVGDGVNDAPALTRADVGIAIGSGTDVAVESADIILVKDNPLDVIRLFRLSKASYTKMVQNLFWATGYNAFAIPLAAGVLLPVGIGISPEIGAIIMSLSTVIVAVNAQLLYRLDLSAV